MKLKQLALDAVSGLKSTPQGIAVEEDGTRLTCHVLTSESLAVSFDWLKLESDKLANADMKRLKEISQKISDRLNYLLEPIVALEFDQQGSSSMLRSNPPKKEPQATSYYELIVRKGGEIMLCRYQKSSGGQPRQRIPCAVTHEVFGRLVEDLDPASV